MVGRFLAGLGKCISSNIESNCMACAECVAVSPKCGKGLPVAVRTCRQSISCFCKSRNTIRREESGMMKTYMNYRKNRRLVKYFFALKKMV